MRHFIRSFTLSIALIMVMALTAIASEVVGIQGAVIAPVNRSGKVECLATNTNCHNTMSFSERIDWIQSEINKGTAVYSNEELKLMRERLDNTIEEFKLHMLGGY